MGDTIKWNSNMIYLKKKMPINTYEQNKNYMKIEDTCWLLKIHYYLSLGGQYHINFMFNYTKICEFEILLKHILITCIFLL